MGDSGISAQASATSGDAATAQTSTSAGTSANSIAGEHPYASATGGTTICKLNQNRGYAISYVDGAYSLSGYKGDTAYATSSIWSGDTLTNKEAKALFRSSVQASAQADTTTATASVTATSKAKGTANSLTSQVQSTSEASVGASTEGWATASARTSVSASVRSMSHNSNGLRTGALLATNRACSRGNRDKVGCW